MYILYFIGFNFIIYSFLGWIIEELYCFFLNRTFKKEGFLSGTIKPMYGIAMTTLILLYEYLNINAVYSIILFFVIPSAVEYISGYLLNSLFNRKYWSYSDLRFNLNGYICLRFSIYWMILSLVGVYVLQNELDKFYYIMNGGLLKAIVSMVNIFITLDFIEKVMKLNEKPVVGIK